jgi:hypothetical protein
VIDDPVWRLNKLYRIVDKKGDSIPFKLNSVQADVLANLHSRNIILKARQLGMSTFAVLYLVDKTMFAGNSSAGIVSYSLEHAQHIFKRIIGHALDSFPEELRPYMGIVNRSAREISFDNGSFLRVDTSLRGGSYQSVLVSEFGKTCARSPQKAEEVYPNPRKLGYQFCLRIFWRCNHWYSLRSRRCHSNTTTGWIDGDNVVGGPAVPTASVDVTIGMPSFRVSIASNTDYFLTALSVFTVGAVTAYGRIKATRVG